MSTILLSSINAWSLHNFRGGLIKALLDRKYRTVILAPRDAHSKALAELGCEVHDIRIDDKGASAWAEAKTLFAYRSAYRRIKPDLAMHFTIKPVIYGSLAARSLGVPSIDMITGLGTAFLKENWLTRVAEGLYRIALRWSAKVFFQNPEDQKLFVERGLVRAEQTERLPGSGINLSHFTVAPYPNNPSPRFLLIARLIGDKGVREFVDAARRVGRTHPGARFQLLGSLGVENRSAISREQVESWVRENIVEYLGHTEDVRPFIAAADCVVLPSYREGTPRTLLEAAAMGRPVIATDVPGCRHVMDDGRTGFHCRVRDAEDLAAKLVQMIVLPRDRRAEMGLNGREKMEREFDERIVIEKYLAAISGVLGHGSPPHRESPAQ